MKLKDNKKGYSMNLFAFFFVLTVLVAIIMFFTIGIHYILNDYGLQTVKVVGQDLIGNAASENSIALDTLQAGHLGLISYVDYLFIVFLIVLFIESILASIAARTAGVFSFFGFVTFGNVILLYLLGFALQFQGWVLNEIFYKIIITVPNTPFINSWLDYSVYIIVVWYLILIAVNRLDIQAFKERITGSFGSGNEARFQE